jgi:hypothetical protein
MPPVKNEMSSTSTNKEVIVPGTAYIHDDFDAPTTAKFQMLGTKRAIDKPSVVLPAHLLFDISKTQVVDYWMPEVLLVGTSTLECNSFQPCFLPRPMYYTNGSASPLNHCFCC